MSLPRFSAGTTRAEAFGLVRRAFTEAGLDSPARDARILLCEALGVDAAALAMSPDVPLGAAGAEHLLDHVARRLVHEPVARILGQQEFWGLPFGLSPETLVPRPDTETVVEAALAAIPDRAVPLRILDLGTGSGILAIAAAKLFRVPVLATDIDARSAQTARDNARLNGVGSLVTAIHAAGLNTPEIAKRAPFDLVMSNILLRPLQRLAAPMARQLSPNARVVLSGVLKTQANAALSAYRSQGLMLERSFPLDGWFTPLMVASSG